MQRFIFTLLFSVIILSCSTNNNGLTTGDPEISFDLNSHHYVFKGDPTISNQTGAWSTKLLGISPIPNIYTFAGFVDQPNNMFIQISTGQDTLKPITYRVDDAGGTIYPAFRLNNVLYGVANGTGSNDFLTLTINTYQNGVVNASFAGKVSGTALTNGAIKNVKIRY